MAPVHFKLVKQDGRGRRISFDDLPDWYTLSVKIHTLFGIPLESLAISYLDPDDDEIAVSSEGELQEFYQTSYVEGKAVKFAVIELPPVRLESRGARSSTPNKNFGQDYEVIDHWNGGLQALASLPIPVAFDADTNAFVEVVNDEESPRDHPPLSTPPIGSSTSGARLFGRTNGNGNAISDAGSVASMPDEEHTSRYPLHVYVRNTKMNTGFASRVSTFRDDSTGREHPLSPQSVPVETPHPFNRSFEEPPAHADEPQTESPPEAPPPPPPPSFSNDFSNFLVDLAQVVATHPSLGVSLHRIFQRASSGSYWLDPSNRGANPSQANPSVSEAVGMLFGAIVNAAPSDAQPHTPQQDDVRTLPAASPKPSLVDPPVSPPPQPLDEDDGASHAPPPHPKDDQVISRAPTPEAEPTPPPPQQENHAPLTPEASRARVEAAKLAYEIEKERYRIEREERRRAKEERKAARNHIPHATITTIPFDLSMMSPDIMSPTTSGDMTSPGTRNLSAFRVPSAFAPARKLGKRRDDTLAQVTTRILRRLSDMGFSEHVYSHLVDEVGDELAKAKIISPDVEENIITTVIQSLTRSDGPQPVSSTSGHRRHGSACFFWRVNAYKDQHPRSLLSNTHDIVPQMIPTEGTTRAAIGQGTELGETSTSRTLTTPTISRDLNIYYANLCQQALQRALEEWPMPRPMTEEESSQHSMNTIARIDAIEAILARRESLNEPNHRLERDLYVCRLDYNLRFPRTFRINDLPAEILGNILGRVVSGQDNGTHGIKARSTITAVCKQWRNSIIADGTMWSTIWFNDYPHFDRSLEYLRRAKNAPLDIRISDTAEKVMEYDCIEAMATPLLEKLTNIRTLVVRLQNWDPLLVFWRRMHQHLADNDNPTLSLERLEFHRTSLPVIEYGKAFDRREYKIPRILLNNVYCPTLKHIALGGFVCDWVASKDVFKNLKFLDIRATPIPECPTFTIFRSLLADSPALTTLILDGAGSSYPNNIGQMTPMAVPTLRRLVFGRLNLTYAAFLLLLFSFPNLVELELLNLNGADRGRFFETLASRNLKSLRHLHIGNIQPDRAGNLDKFPRFIAAIPSIVYLTLGLLDPVFYRYLAYNARTLMPHEGDSDFRIETIIFPKLKVLDLISLRFIEDTARLISHRNEIGLPIRKIYISSFAAAALTNQNSEQFRRALPRDQIVWILPAGVHSDEREMLDSL